MTRRMKDSGVEWIGLIPEDWKIEKTKYHFFNKKEIVGIKADNYERLALTLKGVVKRSKDDNEGLQPEKFETYQILRKNELVFKLIDLQNISTSRIGLSNFIGIVSPAYIIIKANNNINVRFVEKYYLSLWYFQIFNKLGDAGVRSSLNANDLLNILLPIPPLPEQQAIADYLDDKCAQIDNIIATINEQIDVLKQYKKSVITEAVTKGLDSNAPMKDSGVEWIGQIPEKWEVKPIYTAFSEVVNKNYNGEVKTALRFSYGTIIPKENFNSDEDDYVANTIKNYTVVEPGNIVINGLNLNYDFVTKRVAIVNDFGVITSAYITIKPHTNKAYPKFMLYLLKSYDHCRAFHGMGEGVRKILNYSELKKNKVILPPISEQQAIADYLDDKCTKIDAVIADKHAQLETLAAYKKSLIYEYVTGKKSVPGFEEA